MFLVTSLDEPDCRSLGKHEEICANCENKIEHKDDDDNFSEKETSPELKGNSFKKLSSSKNMKKTRTMYMIHTNPNIPSDTQRDFKKLLAEIINHDIKDVLRETPGHNKHAKNLLVAVRNQLVDTGYLKLSSSEKSALKNSITNLDSKRSSDYQRINFPRQTYEWSYPCRRDKTRSDWNGNWNYEDNPCVHWRLYHTLQCVPKYMFPLLLMDEANCP